MYVCMVITDSTTNTNMKQYEGKWKNGDTLKCGNKLKICLFAYPERNCHIIFPQLKAVYTQH
jgi:hypothetical protein